MNTKGIWTDRSPYNKMVLLMGLVLFGGVLSLLIVPQTVALLLGITDVLATSDLSNPSNVLFQKIVAALAILGTFALPAFTFGYLASDSSKDYLQLKKPNSAPLVVATIFLAVSVQGLIEGLSYLNEMMKLPPSLKAVEVWIQNNENQKAVIFDAFLSQTGIGNLVLNIILMALIPAIGEELMFRGVLQRLFISWSKNVHIGIIAAAAVFSAVHVQFYGFLPRMALGVVLGYIYVWSQSLYIPILLHFTNNALAILLSYWGLASVNEHSPAAGNPVLMLLASVVLTLVVMRFMYQRRKSESGETSIS